MRKALAYLIYMPLDDPERETIGGRPRPTQIQAFIDGITNVDFTISNQYMTITEENRK